MASEELDLCSASSLCGKNSIVALDGLILGGVFVVICFVAVCGQIGKKTAWAGVVMDLQPFEVWKAAALIQPSLVQHDVTMFDVKTGQAQVLESGTANPLQPGIFWQIISASALLGVA